MLLFWRFRVSKNMVKIAFGPFLAGFPRPVVKKPLTKRIFYELSFIS